MAQNAQNVFLLQDIWQVSLVTHTYQTKKPDSAYVSKKTCHERALSPIICFRSIRFARNLPLPSCAFSAEQQDAHMAPLFASQQTVQSDVKRAAPAHQLLSDPVPAMPRANQVDRYQDSACLNRVFDQVGSLSKCPNWLHRCSFRTYYDTDPLLSGLPLL